MVGDQDANVNHISLYENEESKEEEEKIDKGHMITSVVREKKPKSDIEADESGAPEVEEGQPGRE